ncbi:bifunctional aldolase/short-chain dehydrogenase [Dictyobacter kobayashii]|uniref:Putative oxidoreductase YuxG n=1 Tax=Dictyobacter kobayashii TaxID=2014872 RepID=A0A402ASY2_9CHLR|nr:bifunctional aldolase/short-chain dehydrogenase [Dictyobacter kobayashii]GCE22191.1 putative oxidoreductase YuxG [Dictyobacter kobayashii]
MASVLSSPALKQLVERSRHLGADRSVCNWGGGNTSAKAEEYDFRGRVARVLWVKGSGSDLATCTEESFTGLYLDDLLPLLEREQMSDAEMVTYLGHCFFDPGRPRPSIETLLHAFLPFTHIDHTHADATNYFACASNGEQLARECFGEDLLWLPYRRPGFGLAREVALAVRAKPEARLVLLARHGLITWGKTDEECYTSTCATIARARDFVEGRIQQTNHAFFGGLRVPVLPQEERHSVAAQIAPVLRGLISTDKPQILRFEDDEAVLSFVSSNDASRLTSIGAACPDHLVHTKPWPLLVEWTPEQGSEALSEAVHIGIATYVARYQAYLEAHRAQDLDPDASTPVFREADAASDPHPRVILIPGVGMFTTGKDMTRADISSQLYHRAIAVMRGAEACGGFISLSNAESYAVEYWPLEQYKLKLAPPDREFARHVVLVTGAGGGIGSAICRRVALDGAHLVVTDIDLVSAEKLANALNQQYGAGRAIALKMDVTNEESVDTAFTQAALAFGGIDIVVNNAGLASSAPITETSLAMWNKNWNVLATGYFLVARAAFQLLQVQGRGGNLVFIASKNALVAGKNAAAYSTAKAAESHLARCLAEEGGQFKIRVNTVNPDAVLSGSRIWDSSWRKGRAVTYGVAPDQLDEVYRKRTTLGVNILPEDIAEAVAFFASLTRSSKSTGNILNVDGGIAAAYPR